MGAVRLTLRSLARRAVRRRSKLWLLLLIPIGLLGIQVVHRMVDVLGSRPVRGVRPTGGADRMPAVESREFLATFTGLTSTALLAGNHVELLFDGPGTLARIEADVRTARRSVAVQTYYCEPGVVTERLKQLMMGKAREGVSVHFLRDGFGCRSLGAGYDDSLRAAGVHVASVRPIHWMSLHRAQHRSHVRSVIVDRHIGYTGGFGLADKWLQDGDRPAWRETTVRFSGPAVSQLAGTFAVGWADATGELLAGDDVYPPATVTDSGAVGGILFTMRSYGTPVPERYLALAIAGARRSIYITNPYFIPNAELRAWLKAAAARGVDVRVLTASENIDFDFPRWAAHSTYIELLEGGVHIAEYTPAMLHAKTMIVDGVFGSVGSLNLDNVSLRINDEALLLVHDSIVGASLDSSFRADVARSREITLEHMRNAPAYDRIRTWVAWLFRDFL